MFQEGGSAKAKRYFQITDPLFEPIDISEDRELSSLYNRLLSSFELRRAQWVNQSGLLFQIYHGCTHTRRAHAIGCWCIGWYALNDIRVWVPARESPISLKDWLMELGPEVEGKQKMFLKAFMAALLLHDIGHTPFSHALELVSGPNFEVNHTQITGSLISGESQEPEGWKWADYLPDYLLGSELRKYRKIYTAEQIRKIWTEKKEAFPTVRNCLIKEGVEPLIVKNIIVKPEEELTRKIAPDVRPKNYDLYTVLYVLHQLVDSQVDVDRIDHFLRDSYFSGLRFADYRIRPFLQNLQIVLKGTDKYHEIRFRRKEKEAKPGYILIKKAGLEYIQHLQAVREFIYGKALWLRTNLCYTGVLAQAVSIAITIKPNIRLKLPFLTDATLFHFLKSDFFWGTTVEGYAKVLDGEIPLDNYLCFEPKNEHCWREIAGNLKDIYATAERVNQETPSHPQILIFSNYGVSGKGNSEEKWRNVVADKDVSEGYETVSEIKGYTHFSKWIDESAKIRENNILFWGHSDIDLEEKLPLKGKLKLVEES